MSSQLSFKSTVKRSSRLNPTLKKNLGFQKLEIEFISKSKKRPRSHSKLSPVLFDSQNDTAETSQEVLQSQLDVRFTQFSVSDGKQSEGVNSQNPITPAACGTQQFSDAVSQRSVPSSLDDIRNFVNGSLDSQVFADEIKKLANEGLDSQNFAGEMRKLANEGITSQDFVDAIKKFTNDSLSSADFVDPIENFSVDGLNSQDFADALENFATTDGLNSQEFADAIENLANDGPDSQDFADEIGNLPNGIDSQNLVCEMKSLVEGVNSQDSATPIKLTDPGYSSQDSAAPVKLSVPDPSSQDIAASIKFTDTDLNSQDIAATVKFTDTDLSFHDIAAPAIFPDTDLSSQDIAAAAKFTDTDLSSQDITAPVKFTDTDLSSQDITAPAKFTDTDLSSLEPAYPCRPNIESMKDKVQKALKLRPIRAQRKAPSTVCCDGNILPESFRKSTARAAKKPAAGRSVSQKMPKSRSQNELVPPCEANASFEHVKNLQSISELKSKPVGTAARSVVGTAVGPVAGTAARPVVGVAARPVVGTAAKPAKRRSRSSLPGISALMEPLKIEVISPKTIPCEMTVSFEPVQSLQPTSKQKKRRRPRTRLTARPAKRKSRNSVADFNSLLEPLQIEVVSQQTVPCKSNVPLEPVGSLQLNSVKKRGKKNQASTAVKPAERRCENTFPDFNSLLHRSKVATSLQKTRPSRKSKPECPSGEPVVIRRTRLTDQKRAALKSAEMELCSLLSNCSVKSGEETLTPCSASKPEIFNSRQYSNVGTAAFVNLPLSDLYPRDSYSANTDDLSDFADIFVMKLNVGNFSKNLNVMSLLRQVTKIQKKLPHFVPPSENWYEGFEIW